MAGSTIEGRRIHIRTCHLCEAMCGLEVHVETNEDGADEVKLIRPEEGMLALFPSWQWHGTRPFAQGERLTMAFDAALG